MPFDALGLSPKFAPLYKKHNFAQPTPIQALAIPAVMSGRDVIASAETGSGKTAAFLLPIITKLLEGKKSGGTRVLVLVPTRELALQVDTVAKQFGKPLGISSFPVYGGVGYVPQEEALKGGADIIVATPGRLLDHHQQHHTRFDKLSFLVLDEADRMLDMGFYDDIVKIVSYLPKDRQTLLFSATMPPKIRALASRILRNPEEINIAIAKPAAGIDQQAYVVYDSQKEKLLDHILKTYRWNSIILFASRKETVKKLDSTFRRAGIAASAFHSDLEQAEREEILRAFKNKQLNFLIGTDVLSRGIDVEGISMVINWDVPPDPEDYVHRIGRTARAETTGTAITFINEQDQRRFMSIENLIGYPILKMALPAGLGEGPSYAPQTKRKENFRKHGRGPRRKHFRPRSNR